MKNDHGPFANALLRRLAPLSETVLVLCQSARGAIFARGESLLRADEHWQHLWWVEQGALRLYYVDREGNESNKNFFLDDAFLWPITPTLHNQPVVFFVDALKSSKVWALPIAPLRQAFADHPGWHDLQHLTLCALLDDKMQREQSFLQTGALERYEKLMRDHPAWVDSIPLKHLASYLGITDVTLSRLRSGMGLIKS